MKLSLCDDDGKIFMKRHGKSHHRLYKIWNNMIQRCASDIKYTSKNLKVSDDWRIIDNFIRDMEPSYKKGLTIDRIDNNKGYSKENCRWTSAIQQNNNKCNITKISFAGLCLSNMEWARLLMIAPKYKQIFSNRLLRGWSLWRAASTPLQRKGE